MTKGMKLLSALAISLCFATGAFAGKVGSFEVKDAEGKKVTQEALKGKKSVVAFLQAACGQCRLELADLVTKADAIKEKANLVLVIVDVNADRALEFFKSENAPGTLLLDPDFKVGAAMEVNSTPSTVVVDKDLNIVKTKAGYRPGDLDKLLSDL